MSKSKPTETEQDVIKGLYKQLDAYKDRLAEVEPLVAAAESLQRFRDTYERTVFIPKPPGDEESTVHLKVEGTGTFCEDGNDGSCVAISWYAGRPKVLVWDDINHECATQIIYLDRALGSNRHPDGQSTDGTRATHRYDDGTELVLPVTPSTELAYTKLSTEVCIPDSYLQSAIDSGMRFIDQTWGDVEPCYPDECYDDGELVLPEGLTQLPLPLFWSVTERLTVPDVDGGYAGKKHLVMLADLRHAIHALAGNHRQQFCKLYLGDADQHTGDVLIQLAIFGEEIYC